MADDLGVQGPAGLKRLAVDMLAGILFLVVYLTTGNIYLGVGLGVATGLLQAVWMIARRQQTDFMQWAALALVIVLGGATMLTHNTTFILYKPTIFEGALGLMLLKPGVLARYMPAYVRDLIPHALVIFWGYLWAFSWLAMAVSNLYVAQIWGLKAWAIYTSVAPWMLWAALFGLGMLVFIPLVSHRARVLGIDLKARRAGR
jgi:intracellular septation protein A